MGEISLVTWLQATFVLLVVAIVGAVIGYAFGAGRTSSHWQKIVATREEAFRNHWKGPVRWYWWIGRDDSRNDRKEFLVGVVADDEKEAKAKLDPARIPLLDKARASGVKDLGLHVLVAYSREDIHVQTV
jgi:hypothetical protein